MSEFDKYLHVFPNEPMVFNEEDMNKLFMHLHHIKASDMKLQSGMPVRAKVSGAVYSLTKRAISANELEQMLMYVYGPNGPARIKSGNAIDMAYELKPNRKDRFRYRINVVGGMINGTKAIVLTCRTIVVDPPTMDDVKLEHGIREAAFPKDGIFIMAGATGSGKSTTLAAIIRTMLEEEDGHRFIVTFEAPIEYVYDTVNKPTSVIFQTEIGPDADLKNFFEGIRSAMRRAPDVILNGEMRDVETVESTLAAAQSGHAVYTTVHANSVADTFSRIIGFFPHGARQSLLNALVSSVRCIVWQTLLRKSDGKGRVAIREYLNFTDSIRRELLSVGAKNMDEMIIHVRTMVEKHGQTAIGCTQNYIDQGILQEADLITIKGFG